MELQDTYTDDHAFGRGLATDQSISIDVPGGENVSLEGKSNANTKAGVELEDGCSQFNGIKVACLRLQLGCVFDRPSKSCLVAQGRILNYNNAILKLEHGYRKLT